LRNKAFLFLATCNAEVTEKKHQHAFERPTYAASNKNFFKKVLLRIAVDIFVRIIVALAYCNLEMSKELS
jgi:hypothetical protein